MRLAFLARDNINGVKRSINSTTHEWSAKRCLSLTEDNSSVICFGKGINLKLLIRYKEIVYLSLS